MSYKSCSFLLCASEPYGVLPRVAVVVLAEICSSKLLQEFHPEGIALVFKRWKPSLPAVFRVGPWEGHGEWIMGTRIDPAFGS